VDVVSTREPGATRLGVQLRRILLDPATGSIASRAETMLYIADRAQHVEETIRPALEAGNWVVTDRYVDSTIAYQGAGRGVPEHELRDLSRLAVDGIRPDLTVVLDIDPETGLARAGASPDRMEAEPLEFHRRVRRSFTDQAARQPGNYLVVDAAASPAEVTRQIRERVVELIDSRREPAPDARVDDDEPVEVHPPIVERVHQ
jgi:dTMP kinase